MASGFRHIIALLLLAVFAVPFVGKPLHLLNRDSCHTPHVHHAGDDDCPICHFTLSWFTETETINTDVLPSNGLFLPPPHCALIFIRPVSVPCLRGPPIV